jgi:hypothetical protein
LYLNFHYFPKYRSFLNYLKNRLNLSYHLNLMYRLYLNYLMNHYYH